MRRLFRAFGLLISGRFKAAWESLLSNKYVVEATYDQAIEKKGENAQTLQKAVAGLIHNKEQRVAKIKTLAEAEGELIRVKTGAAAKAKAQADKLKAGGKTVEQIKLDPEYIRCQTAYESAAAELTKKTNERTELEKKNAEDEVKIARHKATLTNMKESVKNLETEKMDAVARLEAAKEEKAINDALNGISNDTTEGDLAAVRKKVGQVEAEAKVSAELAGTNPDVAKNEFLEYANKSAAASEFDALIGLDTPQQQTAGTNPAKLPEN